MNPHYEIKETDDEAKYNPLALRSDTHFTQGWQYGEWQKSINRNARRFIILKNGELAGALQIITFKLPFGQSILYIPHGPILSFAPDKFFFDTLCAWAKKMLAEEQAMFLRFDFFPPDIADTSAFPREIKKAPGHIFHSAYFQPRNEWVLRLNEPEEKIFSAMHPKARYNANLAKRKGVTVEMSKKLTEHFPDFWSLLEETAERDRFHLQPKKYYETVFQSCAEKQNAMLAIARHETNILAINFILRCGNTAYFVYGGSSNKERNLMPSYLLQTETIRAVKQLGCAHYNFGGVTDGSAQYRSWEGFSAFKKKFGGEMRTYGESQDIIARHFWYYLYDAQRRLKTLWRT